MESDLDTTMFDGQSELYVAVASAYRNAHLKGASELDCQTVAMRAVRSAHPFFLEKEAERLAHRIITQFSERYPKWLSNGHS